ncbi:hypothetical protein BDQ12DRAFT_686710 [Crucibulum laeve]|uniref:Rhodopsin domain-containing protein n=1 Tax=Crucibulum laeve TaxID=68775 RepID=A0A5C3LV29_9AGAR|nr:hypothetical protein BDQ12DRAFT_686710 [Crucibulum laeve]
MTISFKAIQGSIITFHGLAIICTIFRLGHRWRRQRLWWDDFWAFISLISLIPMLLVFILMPYIANLKNLAMWNAWRMTSIILFTTVLWASRLTVAVTIVRLQPKGSLRRYSKAASVVFILIWLGMVLQKIFMCGDVGHTPVGYCPVPRTNGITELATDILADLWLIGGPAYMLLQMRLPRNDNRLLFVIFACGILTTVASIVHSVYILLGQPIAIGLTAHIQAGVSVSVCNLLVVATYFYRIFRNGEASVADSTSDSTSSSNPSSTGPLSTGKTTSDIPLTTLTLTEISDGDYSSDNSRQRTTVNFSSLPSENSTPTSDGLPTSDTPSSNAPSAFTHVLPAESLIGSPV